MSPLRACGLVLAVWTSWTFASGCGSFRNKPAPAIADAGAGVQEPTAMEGPRQPKAPTSPPIASQRLPARLSDLPLSYFGLERNAHTRIRVQTARMGNTEPGGPDSRVMKGFDLAALDAGNRPPDADRWNADAGQGAASWSLGVPVAEETEVKPPLVRRRVPSMRFHVERGTAREILGKFGGRKEENPTVWTFIGNVVRAAGSTLGHPTVLMFRFLDWDLADLDDGSEMELVLGEPIAAASPPAGSDTGSGQGPPPAVP